MKKMSNLNDQKLPVRTAVHYLRHWYTLHNGEAGGAGSGKLSDFRASSDVPSTIGAKVNSFI